MGVPIEKIVISTNANDEVPNFLLSCSYRKIVPSRCCISNAMNVGHPSNFARVVALFGGWMDEVGNLLKMPDMERMKKELWAVSINDQETRDAIKNAWQKYRLLLEPHGAVGWLGLERYLEQSPSATKAVAVETASPAKFPDEIERLLEFSPELPAVLAEVEQKKEQYLSMPMDYKTFHQLLIKRYGASFHQGF
jgi:threonine synthase